MGKRDSGTARNVQAAASSETKSIEASFILPANDAELVERQERLLSERFDAFEVIPIYGASSFFDAWRQGVDRARFPWLILTHQDVEFQELPDFEPYFADPATGLVGTHGSTVITADDPWWFTSDRFLAGQLSGRMRHATGGWGSPVTDDTYGPYGEVVVLDGACLVTTRERLDGIGGVPDLEGIPWDFYDQALSLEFLRRDYRLHTARFELLHRSNPMFRPSFGEARDVFRQHYFADCDRYEVRPTGAVLSSRPDGSTDELLAEAARLQRDGAIQEAERLCQALLRDEPANALIYDRLGLIAFAGNRFDQAVDNFSKAIELDPTFAAAHANLGAADLQRGDQDEAIKALDTAIDLDPAIPDAYNNLGAAFREAGETAAAVVAIRHALDLQPETPGYVINLGRTLIDGGHATEGIQILRLALRLVPDDARTHLEIGNALRTLNRPSEAVEEYRIVIAAIPAAADVYSSFALALAETGAIDEAVEALDLARQLGPGNSTMIRDFAAIIRAQGHADTAAALEASSGHRD